jgi:hypothetical protein
LHCWEGRRKESHVTALVETYQLLVDRPLENEGQGRAACLIRQRNFPIVRGGSPEPPREFPAAGAFTRHSCAAGQETRRAKWRCSTTLQ